MNSLDRFDSAVGKRHAIEPRNLPQDLLVAVAERKQGKDFALKLISQVSLVLFNDLWFQGACAVARSLELELTDRAFNSTLSR